jgi:hypothetical protein
VSAPAATNASQQLGLEHYREICDEIGARLAFMLRPTSELPPRLAELLDRLALLDHDAPSIAPSMEHMIPLKQEAPLPRS